jgi:precorrin isomerase
MLKDHLHRATWRNTIYRIIFETDTPFEKLFDIMLVLSIIIIIAVPTGIVTAEMTRTQVAHNPVIACPHCMLEGHESTAVYCRRCGEHLLDHTQSKSE